VLAALMRWALTLEWSKERRVGRLYLDVLRGGYAQTAVAPYSVRPLRGAPVAVPLRWEELDEPGFDVRRHTLRTVPARVEREGDPWAGMESHARSLEEPRRRLARVAGRSGPDVNPVG
jgi:bifunctional non-homologous end joining protein LigD